jgi:hypothetical protein
MPWWVFVATTASGGAKLVGTKVANEVDTELQKQRAGNHFKLEENPPRRSRLANMRSGGLQGMSKRTGRESTYEEYDGILRRQVLPKFEGVQHFFLLPPRQHPANQ